MIAPAQFWLNLLPPKNNGDKPAAKRHEYCHVVLKLLNSRHPDLYTGERGATLSEGDAQSLLDRLQKKSPGHILKHRICYLIRGLEYGALELDWDVVIPDPPVVISREKPRLTHDHFKFLPIVYAVEKAFLESLKQPPPTPNARIGQLLLSAMLFGGLVRNKLLTAWVQALPGVQCDGNVLWVDMVTRSTISDGDRRTKEKAGSFKPGRRGVKDSWDIRRRWLADPLTHALIIRWLKKYPEDNHIVHTVEPAVAIRHYLAMILPQDKKTLDLEAKMLLSGSATRLGLQVPAFLQAYAEGRVKSVSLPTPVLNRLLTGKCVQLPDQSSVRAETPHPIDARLSLCVSTNPAPPVHQEIMLNEVRRKILPFNAKLKRVSSESRAELQSYLDSHHEEMCQTLSCLVLWCIDLLTAYQRQELIRGRVKGKLRASSVRAYLSTIGKRLISVAGRMNILELDGDELHDLYAEVIESCPTIKSKHTAGARIYSFHQFLMIRLGAPQVDFSDLSRSTGPVEMAVDANLISLYSFDQIKKVLCPSYLAASRLRKMSLLITIIAFRCGLRKSEALKLRLMDLQGLIEPELLVRNNQYAYVKSNESIRRIPLAPLLEAEELKLILDWRKMREFEERESHSPSLLFCLEYKPMDVLVCKDVFTSIMQAVHQVTGDNNLVFHHFRHSFATWLLLRLLKNVPDSTRQRLYFLQHPLFSPEARNKLRSALLGNQQLGRKALYATAQLCGHASPEVTLLHYVHLCDILLQTELSLPDNQPHLDASTIMALTGLPQHVAYYDKKASNSERWQMSIYLDRLDVPEEIKPRYSPRKVSLRSVPEALVPRHNVDVPLWMRIFNVIRERQLGRVPFETLASFSGFSENEIRNWYSNLECLAGMETRKGKLRHINGVTNRKNTEFHFPEQVRLQEDKVMADAVLACFEASRGQVRVKIIEGARYFIGHFTAAKGAVRCQTIKEVKKNLKYLLLLKIQPRQIQVSYVQARRSRLPPTDKQKKLADEFNLPATSIVILDSSKAETYLNGFYQVKIVNSRQDSSGRIKANYGFRFAMYLIVIMAGN